jgi:hypothetical protein
VKKFVALLGAISLLALTGCGRMDKAASIGDVTVTQAQAQAVVDQILKSTKVDTTECSFHLAKNSIAAELRFTIITVLFEKIAKELKIEVTPTEIDQRKSDLISQVGGESELLRNLVGANIASSNFEKCVKAILTSEKISQALKDSGVAEDEVSGRIGQLVTAKAKQLKVTVNPRYGVWDLEQGDIVAKDSAGSAVVPSGK